MIKLVQVKIPHHSWYEDEPITLSFPDDWRVHRCGVASEGADTLTPAMIKAAMRSPIGQRPLAKLAEKAEEAVIIFDDMTRPTKIYQYSPFILKTLHDAGVPKDNIRFIIAAGTHGTYGRIDFTKKLGDDIVSEYQVYNHNPYEMLDYLGDTQYGCPVWVNSEVMSCDLKIGVGTVLFHRLAGFSGGGKLISPGVAGIETIRHNHGEIGGFGPDRTPHESTGYLRNDTNRLRLDAEEAARMTGLDFKVDTVLNLRREPIELYAGDFVETQRQASKAVMRWHSTESPQADVVVVGSYLRENEPYLGLWPAYNSVKEGGTIVLFNDDPNGDINHWLFNRHGKHVGASLWNPQPQKILRDADLIIYGGHPFKSFLMRYDPEQTTWIRSWEEVIEKLRNKHKAGSSVAVIPDGTSCIPEKALEDHK